MLGLCGDNREAYASFEVHQQPRSYFDAVALLGLVTGYIIACISYFILGKDGAIFGFIVAVSNIFAALLGVEYQKRKVRQSQS